MTDVLFAMAALIAVGAVWRSLSPGGLGADRVRAVLTGTVYRLFLPALVLEVLWRAPLGQAAVKTAACAAVGVVAGLLAAWGVYRVLATPKKAAGALLLAAAFPNATYLGLPVLERVLGEPGRGIAIQYDLFACTPLLLTVGILVAGRYGSGGGNPFRELVRVPPLWAAGLGVGLNLGGVVPPEVVTGILSTLGQAVVPLMLFSIGLSLSWQTWGAAQPGRMAPAVAIQLLLNPLVVWGLAGTLGLSGDRLVGVVLEGAMPCMVLGVVLCDRFRLDTGLYAGVVTVSTVLSLVTLPMWFSLVA